MSSKKKDRSEQKPRLSPTSTLAHVSDEFIRELGVPKLPENIPDRLEESIRKRINALLYHLKEAKKNQYVEVLEIRLVREAHRAVLTAYELGLVDGEVFYASFRTLVEELGYERTDVGFKKKREDGA